MERPLMPKATAVWLIEHSALTFDQIAEFCGLHELEVQGIADGEVNPGMHGLDPVLNGQLTWPEIRRCEGDQTARLQMNQRDLPEPAARGKGPRYTPVAKRGDKPDAIAWLLRNHPELPEAVICRLIGTTKPTIAAVRDRSHWNATNIRARHPVTLGLCTQIELDDAVEKAGGTKKMLTDGDAPVDTGIPPVVEESAEARPSMGRLESFAFAFKPKAPEAK